MISRLAGPRFRVRLEIPRTGGWREWGAVAGAFEQRLEAQASATVTGPRIDSEMRRGRDYVRVAMSVTVDAPDIAQAAVVAWRIVQQAAAADVSAWDMAGASAEIRPAGKGLTRRRQRHRGRSPRLPSTDRDTAGPVAVDSLPNGLGCCLAAAARRRPTSTQRGTRALSAPASMHS
jgi:hypothetical protein